MDKTDKEKEAFLKAASEAARNSTKDNFKKIKGMFFDKSKKELDAEKEAERKRLIEEARKKTDGIK